MPLTYLYGQDKVVAQFVAGLIPHCAGYGFGAVKTIGVVDGDRLIAGVVYGNWHPEAGVIEIAAAAVSPRWLTRRTIEIMYGYVFDQLGCQMVVQRTPADNERLLRQLAAGGYDFVLVPRLLGRDRDCVVCTLTREAYEASKFIRRSRQLRRAA